MVLETFFDPYILIAAFAGGAFGAALGALPAFIFTGFMVVAGEAATVAGGEAAGSITGQVAFGPPFSPAISFAGGAAAAAYAAKKGYIDSGFAYYKAKDIGFALGTKPDVLLVGGAFGILGYWLTAFSAFFSLPYDHIAMGVVVSALIHRVVFGYDLIGKPRGDGYFDMSPFERDEMRVIGDAATDGGQPEERLSVEPWLPHQYKWGHVAMIGLAAGLLGGFIALETGSAFLGFGISAASLLFLNLGVERIPVTHHMTLPASTAAIAVTTGGTGLLAGGPTLGLLIAGVFGIVCALFGEVFQRVFYAHGDTHVDPPAAAIVFGTLLVAICALAGIFPNSAWVALPV
ncbi:hypothetical protein ACNS7O_13255 [Haloferacaceae archaeon DSL9]